MLKEITAKTVLSSVPHGPEPWFGTSYGMNLYRGCQHHCIYCDSRSECYQLDTFDTDVLAKTNAIDLLAKELRSKRRKGTVGTGSMNDPYMPAESTFNLTGRALAVIAEQRFPVHVITKSSMVLRDIGLLQRIGEVYAAVSFSITTADDDLGRKVEPGASPVSERFRALKALRDAGVYAGVTMMPILPFIEDTEENVLAIVRRAADCGANYILPAMAMTLRDRQRAYFYDKLDVLFPGVRRKYEERFGDRYEAPSPHAQQLSDMVDDECKKVGITTKMRFYDDGAGEQLSLL